MNRQIVRVDGIKWWVYENTNGIRIAQPLCPEHDLRLTPIPPRIRTSRGWDDGYDGNALRLSCAENHEITLKRKFNDEKTYVINRIDAKIFKGMKVVDLDGELTPIAKEKLKSEDGKYFVTSQLMQSKRGLQLVVYAGEKGTNQKTQIFIEPEVKRLAFDQKDLNPSDVFTSVKAIFPDGSSHEIKEGES